MVYEEKIWASKEIINREELQHIEDGIVEAYNLIGVIQNTLAAFPASDTLMTKSVYDSDIDGKVEFAELSDTLKSGTSTKTYEDIISDINTSITTHSTNNAAHHVRYTDLEAQNAINIDTDHGSTAQHNYRTDEEIRDISAAMMIAGTGVAITTDDAADIVTIALSDNAFTTIYKDKLDGIETGATADMNGSEIVAAVNNSSSQINTANLILPDDAFTPTYQTKLDGIETGATADMNGSEIVAAINASSSVINPANIDRGNLATVIERGFIGEVSNGDSIRVFNPRAGTLQSVTLISETQPITNPLMVDVRKNGISTTNSIFTSDTPMILSTTATPTNGVYSVNGTLDSLQTSLNTNDVLRIYVIQSGSVVDVSVCFEILY